MIWRSLAAREQCPFARTLRALAFFGGIKPDESDALALLVDHVAFKDINILRRNRLGDAAVTASSNVIEHRWIFMMRLPKALGNVRAAAVSNRGSTSAGI
jgi:hypothetical protein